jgi:hypothetical protein
MPNRILSLVALLACTAAVGSCDAVPMLTGACTHELAVRLAPLDTTVHVGEAYYGRAALSTCGGQKQLPDRFAWTAADPAIVQVDASGRIRALATGETEVTVSGERYGRLGTIRVTVR